MHMMAQFQGGHLCSRPENGMLLLMLLGYIEPSHLQRYFDCEFCAFNDLLSTQIDSTGVLLLCTHFALYPLCNMLYTTRYFAQYDQVLAAGILQRATPLHSLQLKRSSKSACADNGTAEPYAHDQSIEKTLPSAS